MTKIHSLRTPSFLALLATVALLAASGCADLDPCKRGAVGCACRAEAALEAGEPACDSDGVCALGTCFVQGPTSSATACYNACSYREDGICDDGGEGSEDSLCNFGSDCSDCGIRENPCSADPSNPVFCPQTPLNCWPSNTDCLSVRWCTGETSPFGCQSGQSVDCSLAGPSRCINQVCSNPARARCVGENACVQAYTDCSSLAMCGAAGPFICFRGETLECSGTTPTCTR